MKVNIVSVIITLFVLVSCKNESETKKPKLEEKNTPEFQNKGHELVYTMVQKVGAMRQLYDKKGIIYTYTYQLPDGKEDISTEKYIFNGELSYGAYHKHERTLPNLKGVIEQGYDGNEFWFKHNGEANNDSKILKRVAFNRPTNFYWFAMMQKLLDPGLRYTYLKEEKLGDHIYDIVKVSFDSEDDAPKDTYQLYINRESHLVDQFLFTVVDFGKIEPLLMKVAYEKIDGILIPTKRKYKKSNWDAVVTQEPWILVTWSNIKFTDTLTIEDFKK